MFIKCNFYYFFLFNFILLFFYLNIFYVIKSIKNIDSIIQNKWVHNQVGHHHVVIVVGLIMDIVAALKLTIMFKRFVGNQSHLVDKDGL